LNNAPSAFFSAQEWSNKKFRITWHSMRSCQPCCCPLFDWHSPVYRHVSCTQIHAKSHHPSVRHVCCIVSIQPLRKAL
jgi:hypothetical protein